VRVNPDVDAKTHRHTTTGIRETKFGIDRDKVPALFAAHRETKSIDLCGLHVHLGSPITDTGVFVEGIERLLHLADDLERCGASIRRLDIGGGYAADYETGNSPSAAAYAEVIVPLLEKRVKNGLRVVLEPGRSIAANAGVLLLRVIYRKRSGSRDFLILDGGMNVLLRPSHYEAFHFAWPAETATPPPTRCERPDVEGLELVDLVGPICETGDFIARDRPLPRCEKGDLIAVFAAGAYGMTMASNYNAMPLPAEIMVEGASARVIRRRETIDDLLALER
jgi:diaminopimelate decarboxylase